MQLDEVLSAIETLDRDELARLRAKLDVLLSDGAEKTVEAPSQEARQTADNLMDRFPEALRKLANR